MAMEEKTEAAFWTQQTACDPAEAALELRMEITSATVLAALFAVFGLCTLMGLFVLPQDHTTFWAWTEVIVSAVLFGIMGWALRMVSQRKAKLREMEGLLNRK
ncbi:MAG: hypothetical protein QHH30_09865 [candidate division NC10 bacterium]|nr:hypothetical protein [candidate division NC10 bacterium]